MVNRCYPIAYADAMRFAPRSGDRVRAMNDSGKPHRTPIPTSPELSVTLVCAVLLAGGSDIGWAASAKHASWQSALPPEADRLKLGPSADVPVAVAARAVEGGGVTRLMFDLSAKVGVNAFVLDKPGRVIVDLPEVNFQIEPEAGRLESKGVGLIRSFRFGLFAPDKSRIVIDLAGPATLRKVAVESIAGGDPSRLTIELAKTDRASFRAAAHHDQILPTPVIAPAASNIAAPKADPKPVIVIDPGHGGIDPGASGIGGVAEKYIVFDFASALAAKLAASGRYQVMMTRTSDSFVSLGDRVRVARDAGAALFMSVHADTLSDATVTGATVYTSSDRASDAEAARVAASENQADEAAGLDSAPETPGVSDILFDLTRRETRTYAHLFQRTLVGYWQKIARLNKNPERSAGFKVLQAPDVPSVLLELGYLSSDRDSRVLTSPDWRDKATATVAASIDSFFARRQAPSEEGPSMSPTPESWRPPGKVVATQPHL